MNISSRVYGSMTTLRLDLSDYRVYIEALQDKLNEDGAYTMSMTDAVKIAIKKSSGEIAARC